VSRQRPSARVGGSGIFLLRDGDPNTNAIVETATREGRRPVIAQAWLPVAEHGDKRIFLLDGEPLGGGTPHATTLTMREHDIARTVGVACRELGLALVGLDVMPGHLTEINVTSPTGFREIEHLTSMRPQEHVLNWLTARLPVRSGALSRAA
jgi:glutathione synthase